MTGQAWPGHTVVLGRTGSGKTHYVAHTLIPAAHKQQGVFLWQGGHDDLALPVPYLRAIASDGLKQLLAVLDKRRVVLAYTPSIRQELANKELAFWQGILFTKYRDLLFILDESQRYAPQGSIDTGAHLLATGGRRWGIACVFVCQRVAELSKTIAAQCRTWIIFEHSSIDSAYLRERGIELSDAELDGLRTVKYSHLVKYL